MEKLYAYVDETGQDTQGTLFIVAVVVASPREALRRSLEVLERETGKGRTKWIKTRKAARLTFWRRFAAEASAAWATIWVGRLLGSRDYVPFVIATTARAILGTAGEAKYRVTVLVDGLRWQEQRRFAKGLRERRVKVRKVRGLRGSTDPFLRLADAAAGLARAAYEGQSEFRELYQRMVERGLIREVP